MSSPLIRNEVICLLVLKVVGRHVASDRMVSGAYKTEFGDSDEISQCMKKVNVSHFGCKNVLFMKRFSLTADKWDTFLHVLRVLVKVFVKSPDVSESCPQVKR